ncbi:flavin reductase family protein [Thauera butanivorans]|uniref:flavin reductase family protein n=1 Tax=Thauera butanivorans TaxID=86174 RepID=UPI001FE23EC4|nr:flavin reductase family protein [Thauera butanivorans]
MEESSMMKPLVAARIFTLLEPGPVVLVTTRHGGKSNIMTISWTMVLDFTPRFAICTGAWNHSFTALEKTRECVIAIPPADMLDTVIGIGTCSGADTDKFTRFGLTPSKGKHVQAPLIAQCLANIECRVAEIIAPHGIVVLDGLAAYVDHQKSDQRMLHAVGDGTFVADGERFDRKEAMRSKLPDGV